MECLKPSDEMGVMKSIIFSPFFPCPLEIFLNAPSVVISNLTLMFSFSIITIYLSFFYHDSLWYLVLNSLIHCCFRRKYLQERHTRYTLSFQLQTQNRESLIPQWISESQLLELISVWPWKSNFHPLFHAVVEFNLDTFRNNTGPQPCKNSKRCNYFLLCLLLMDTNS